MYIYKIGFGKVRLQNVNTELKMAAYIKDEYINIERLWNGLEGQLNVLVTSTRIWEYSIELF